MSTGELCFLGPAMFFILLCLLVCHGVLGVQDLNQSYPSKSALEDLKHSLTIKYNKRPARNVILFIGEGMGPNTITAARMYQGGETSYLAWEKFPHVGALKVTDPCVTSTTLLTGVKGNCETVGVASTVRKSDCDSSIRKENRLVNVATLAQQEGKATGLVTTARITHATPAAMYAHTPYKNWECDTKVPNNASRCKDIARQLVEDEPGKNFNVIMGGGRQQLKTNTPSTPQDPVNKLPWSCVRKDGRDLIAEWTRGRELQGAKYALPKNAKDLRQLDTNNTDYILGIFQNDHFPFAHLKNTSANGVPTLEEMTTTAIKVLKNKKRGFFLMVESALIDQIHHTGKAEMALSEIAELSKAVDSTMNLLETLRIKDDTLVLVTSDRSVSRYPDAGSNISGLAGKDGASNTTSSKVDSGKNVSMVREDLAKMDSQGSSDVFVYASGPYAYLFHNMHEQTYVAEVIKYAARFGDFSQHRTRKSHSASSRNMSSVMSLVIALIIYAIKR